jgi:NADPH:quinone reductase-like Zn-dependent oxidoreductase
MRAVRIGGYGGPEVMSVADVPMPGRPGPGKVLVKVAAAGVNPADWKIRAGYLRDFLPLTFPATLGSEIAGVVEAVGDGVSAFVAGDTVNAATGLGGGYAEFVLIDASILAKIPANLGLVEAAALPVAACTALAAFDLGGVTRGTRVLLHAAAGGVGTLTVQLARLRGAEVTALASPGNFDFLRSLGATDIVDRTGDYERHIGGFDVVIDGAGPEAQARSWKLLKRGGIMLSLVAPPSEEEAAAHDVRVGMVYGMPNGAGLADVNALVGTGEVKVHVSRTYSIDKAAEALAESQAGKVRGKLVLTF